MIIELAYSTLCNKMGCLKMTFATLPVSHVGPLNPGAHLHVGSAPFDVHVPPFLHGFGLQGAVK